jgi:hypothetical protein
MSRVGFRGFNQHGPFGRNCRRHAGFAAIGHAYCWCIAGMRKIPSIAVRCPFAFWISIGFGGREVRSLDT